MVALLVAFGSSTPFWPALAMDVPFASIVLFRTIKGLNRDRPISQNRVESLTGYKFSKHSDLVLDSGAQQYREITKAEVHLKPDHSFKSVLLYVHPGLTVTPEEVEGVFGHPEKIDPQPTTHLPANKNALVYAYDKNASGMSFEFERPKKETASNPVKLRSVSLY
jgi:hypothetical protein